MATTMISIHHAFQPLVCSLPYSSSSTISTSRSLLNSPNPHYKFISSVSKITKSKVKKLKWNALYADDDDEGYLVDAPVSVGDGFSFSGGKYSDMPSKADEWFKQGKIIKAYSVDRGTAKAKDPFFGLTMGEASQVQEDAFRWFYVEAGDPSSPSVVLIHGLPSQAYSFRKVFPILSKDYHVIAFDWLGIWEGILVRLLWRSIVLQFGFADALPFVPTLACVFEGGVREVGAAQGHCLPSSYAIQNFVVYVILFRSLDPNVFLSHGV